MSSEPTPRPSKALSISVKHGDEARLGVIVGIARERGADMDLVSLALGVVGDGDLVGGTARAGWRFTHLTPSVVMVFAGVNLDDAIEAVRKEYSSNGSRLHSQAGSSGG
jgi:hypothetical protein